MTQPKTLKYIRSEFEDQILCIQYLDILELKGHKIKYTAIPNSTFTKSWKAKIKNKQQGVRAGFPDMAIIINGTLLFVELKKEKGGVVSQVQKEWIQALNEAGEYAYICKGFGEFKKLVDKALELNPKSKTSNNSLEKWQSEKWKTSDGKPAIRKSAFSKTITARFLPSKAWDKLSPSEVKATNAKKIRSGVQFVSNTKAAKSVGKQARSL